MRGPIAECSVWLAQDKFKRIQMRVFPQQSYELRFIAGTETQGSIDITPEEFRAVLHDYHHFSFNDVSLTYDTRHVLVRIQGHRWASIPDIDLMKLENFALSGECASFDSLS